MTATYNELRQLNKCSGSCSKYTVMPHCLTNIKQGEPCKFTFLLLNLLFVAYFLPSSILVRQTLCAVA